MVRTAFVAVLTILVFEAGVRALGPALPQLTTWREPMVAAKVARMDELSRDGRTDVVLAGTSQMLFAGDPMMLRRDLRVPWSVYNAAIWGAPPVVNEHWLTKVVAPRLRPRTIVLGVSPLDFVEGSTDDAVKRYFDSLAVRDGWLARIERSLSSTSMLVRERRTLRDPELLMDSIGRRIHGEPGPELVANQIDTFGRAPRRDAATFDSGPAARRMVAGVIERGWKVSGRHVQAFRRTIATLGAIGSEVLVADMAISQPLIEMLGTDGYASFRSFLRREADALGVPVLDTAGGVTSTTFFFDFDHVNRSGADVFNTVLWRALRTGTPGEFDDAIALNVRSEPLAPALASDVLEREQTQAAANAKQQVNLGTVAKPRVSQPTVPPAPAVDVPLEPTPAVPSLRR